MIANDHQIFMLAEIAIEEYPRECVVAFKKTGGIEKLDNIANNPEIEFAVSSDQWLAVDKETSVLVHSHPDGPAYPSEADMRTQIALNVPFGIIQVTDQGAGGYFEFGGVAYDLENRPFRHGVTDCFSLIRDYHKSKTGINIPEFPRSWEWWQNGKNLYLEEFGTVGFVKVADEDIAAGDMIMFNIGGKVCHAGVYIGNGLMAHHLGASKGYDPTRKPMIDSIDRWQKRIVGVYRHKELIR